MITRFDKASGYPQLLQQFQGTEELLRSHGLKFKNTSRWQRYKSILTKTCQGTTLSSDEIRLLPEILIECESFMFAVKGVADSPEVAGWQERTRKALGGRDSSGSETGNTPARDAQSELLIAAMLRRGGLLVAYNERPDVMVELSDGTHLGVEVKRLKSSGQLEATTKKAGLQLKKGAVDGVPALDLAFFRSNRISAPNRDMASEMLRSETRDYALRNWDALMSAVKSGRGHHTIGILLATAKMAYIEDMNEPAAVFCLYVNANASDPRRRMVDEIYAHLAESGNVWFNRQDPPAI